MGSKSRRATCVQSPGGEHNYRHLFSEEAVARKLMMPLSLARWEFEKRSPCTPRGELRPAEGANAAEIARLL
jgi:hypothetical protein